MIEILCVLLEVLNILICCLGNSKTANVEVCVLCVVCVYVCKFLHM